MCKKKNLSAKRPVSCKAVFKKLGWEKFPDIQKLRKCVASRHAIRNAKNKNSPG